MSMAKYGLRAQDTGFNSTAALPVHAPSEWTENKDYIFM